MAPAAKFDDTFALAYGSITLLGGLIGYLKANSYASLIASSIFGGTIFYATTQLPYMQASRVLFAVGALLSVFFLRKFVISFKVMPAGVMSGLSLFAVYKYGKELGLF